MALKTWMATAMLVGLWTGSAYAEEGVLSAESEMRFKEGLDALNADKCEQARVGFLQVLSLEPDNAKVLLNLAISEDCTGHYVQALGHLKAYLASPKNDPNKVPGLKEKMFRTLWQATGHLRIFADRGESVTLEEGKLGTAPFAELVDVKPGTYKVASNGRVVHVTVAAGETADVHLASQDASSPAGRRNPYWTAEHLAGVSLGAAAVVAAGLGMGFLAAHQSHVSDGKEVAVDPFACAVTSSRACTKFDDAHSSAKTTATVSTVSFVAAGALAVGAVVLLVPWQKKEGARVRARLIPTGQGVLLDGAF